jgi:uncharacterized protein
MTRVVDNPGARRFEAYVDGALAGFAEYQPHPDRIVFTHTEVDPAFEGKGVGSRLAAGALDAVRARGLRVVPLCPFIAGYLSRHPEYADLVDSH